MTSTSSLLNGGQTVRGSVGPAAIHADDLLLVDPRGLLTAVQVSDYAAVANLNASAVASTTISASNQVTNPNGRNCVVNSDLSFVVGAPHLGTNQGVKLFKYSLIGGLLSSIVLDTTASAVTGICLALLSNGNIAVTWGFLSTANMFYAVVDPTLSTIVQAKTALSTTAAYDGNGFQYSDLISLSGGGFATAVGATGGIQYGVFSNAGAVVAAVATISGSPAVVQGTDNNAPRMAQLSTGNVALAITCTVAAKALGHAIMPAGTGSAVLAYAVLDAATWTNAANLFATPKISAMATGGFYATAVSDGTNYKGYVLNSAGALQGSAFSMAAATNITTGGWQIGNDGTSFWAKFTRSDAGTFPVVVWMPTTGTGYVATTLGTAETFIGDLFIEKGLMVSNTQVVSLNSTTGAAQLLNTHTVNTPGAGVMRAVGDYAMLSVGNISTAVGFVIGKYQNSAIVGVSTADVAASLTGAVSTPVVTTYSHGGAAGKNGYPINAIKGTVGKSFDHSATNIVGNKGTLLGNGACLEGII
jgi:hypothetical protein